MSLTNTTGAVFIPEMWLPLVQKAREKNLVAAKRVFDVSGYGEVKSKGDVIHVPKVSNLSASDKTATSELTMSAFSELEFTLTIDSHKGTRVGIEDITKVQSAYDLVSHYSEKVGESLARALDADILALGTGLSGTVGALASTQVLADTMIVEALRKLDSAEAPQMDRSIILDAYGLQDMRLIDKFTRYDAVGQAAGGNPIVNGKFGTIYGVDVYVSNNLVSTSAFGGTATVGLVLHKEAFAYATQMNPKIEMYRNTPFLRDEIFGQELYGVAEYRDDHGVALRYGQA